MSNGKIRVLFRIGHLYHRASLDPIYECMKDRPGYDIYFTCPDDRERVFLFFQRSLRTRIEEGLRSEGLKVTRETRGFDVVVTGDVLRAPREYGDALLCFINHGTGIKTILYRLLAKARETRYLIFVEGEYRRKRIDDFGVRGSSEVHVVGYPKLDPVFQGRLDRDAIMREWGLDPEKKTVLFAPTYKPTCIDKVREEILKQTTGHNLVIKLHQYSWRGKYAPHRHHKLYEEAVKRYPHARLIPPDRHNIIPFIYVADTMLSEASSTIFEFLALGKVGIIFDLECDSLSHHDGMPILDEDNRRFLEGAFVHISEAGRIGEAVERALDPDAAMRARIEEMKNLLFYKLDGHAAQRIVNIIEDRTKSTGANGEK
ncbi:MAG: CDP-glycerol glycerophosphotransferase family protein [bacterium]